MAIEPSKPSTAPAAAVPSLQKMDGDSFQPLVIYQHSNMFYWWPVWFFGFIFAAISFVGNHQMAIVPAGSQALAGATVKKADGTDLGIRDILVLDKDHKHAMHKNPDGSESILQPTIYVSRYRSLGTMFLFVLLLVIFITNIALRGQWSLVVIITLILVAVIFWLAGYWEVIFERLGNLSIYINLGGYMMISLVVFILWIVNFFFFDRQIYVIFTPGQVRLCLEIGSGETIYDSLGMTVQKQRSDIFRHVILGFGSGDLILRFQRVEHPIELHNVLGISKALKRIEMMTKERIVVTENENGNPAPPRA